MTAQLLPAIDQASPSLSARVRFAVRVGPARLTGEIRVLASTTSRRRSPPLIGRFFTLTPDPFAFALVIGSSRNAAVMGRRRLMCCAKHPLVKKNSHA